MLAIYIFVALISAASASVHCEGNIACYTDRSKFAMERIHDQLEAMIAQGEDTRRFAENEQIACAAGKNGSFCAYYKTISGTGTDAEVFVQQLRNRGCKHCGEVAATISHDLAKGSLVVDFVKEPCCEGDCFC